MFTMIIIKYFFFFNFTNFCVTVSLFLIKSPISVLLILLTFSTNLSYSISVTRSLLLLHLAYLNQLDQSLTVFLTRSFFTATLSLLKSTGLVSNIRISNLPYFLHTLFKSFATFSNLSIAHLSISNFTLRKLTYLGKSVVSTLLSTVFFRVNFVI